MTRRFIVSVESRQKWTVASYRGPWSATKPANGRSAARERSLEDLDTLRKIPRLNSTPIELPLKALNKPVSVESHFAIDIAQHWDIQSLDEPVLAELLLPQNLGRCDLPVAPAILALPVCFSSNREVVPPVVDTELDSVEKDRHIAQGWRYAPNNHLAPSSRLERRLGVPIGPVEGLPSADDPWAPVGQHVMNLSAVNTATQRGVECDQCLGCWVSEGEVGSSSSKRRDGNPVEKRDLATWQITSHDERAVKLTAALGPNEPHPIRHLGDGQPPGQRSRPQTQHAAETCHCRGPAQMT